MQMLIMPNLYLATLRVKEFYNKHGSYGPNYTLNNINSSTISKNHNRYSLLVLRRSEHDGIGLEDVDTLQLELEALLSATVVRKFTLKEETKVLSNIEKYKSGGKLHKKVICFSKLCLLRLRL